ncbi:MAG: esterase-like activity of phytase family protein, partial [Ilumatobacteraceae bacterium]
DDFLSPSGTLHVIDVGTRQIVKTFQLGGQPDSDALSPDGKYAAIVLENQRNEDLNDGALPQLPGGQLVVIETQGNPDWWPLRFVDFTSLPMADADDPEPEFVDINRKNQAVVTLQENNHIAVVDLRTGKIVRNFPAGEVTLENVDATDDDLLSMTETITRLREPDTVNWVSDDAFAIANEGDYAENGGSRSFTIFDTRGHVRYESGPAFEYASIRAGHYNDGRSDAKGVEPEALEYGEFNGDDLLFIGAERANIVGVYDLDGKQPELLQMLPTGIGPEGMKAIEKRGLLVIASETSVDEDDPAAERTIPSMITIYERQSGEPEYPQLESGDLPNGLPIPWVAMSGLSGDPVQDDTLYAVNDSALSEAGIYTIDTSDEPAVITNRMLVTDPDTTVRDDLDLEGIARRADGGFWLASEGDNDEISNRIIRVDDAGVVQAEVGLPAGLLADGQTSSGFEGVAVTGSGADEVVYVVIQRPWPSDAAGTTKIGRYEVASGTWTFVAYALDPVESPFGGWVGLSEITLLPDGTFAVIERDNQLGTVARIKRIYGVDLANADFQPYVTGTPLPVVPKTLLADVLDELTAASVWTPDKLEGLGVTLGGTAYMVTDNDGLDDAVGQTVMLPVDLG